MITYPTTAGVVIISEKLHSMVMAQVEIKTHEGGGGDDILLGTFSLVGLETSPCSVASTFGTAN